MSARPSRSEAGLLLAYLRPERARLLVLGCVLLVSTIAPVAGPVLLGYAIDAALRGGPSSDLVAIAVAFLGGAVGFRRAGWCGGRVRRRAWSARALRSEGGLLLACLRPARARLLVRGCVLLVSTLAPVAGPVRLGYAIDAALRGEPSSDLVAIAMAFLGVTVGSDILQVLVTWTSVDLAWRVGNRLRLDLCRHALRLALHWHGPHSPGPFIKRPDRPLEALVTFPLAPVAQDLGHPQ